MPRHLQDHQIAAIVSACRAPDADFAAIARDNNVSLRTVQFHAQRAGLSRPRRKGPRANK